MTALFLFILLQLAMNSHAFAATIKIGYIPGFGFADSLETASARGYIFQLLERAESFSSYTFEYVPYADGEMLIAALENNEVDVAIPLLKRNNEDYNIIYSDDPFGISHTILVKSGEDFGFYQDPAQIDGKTVASYFDNPIEIILDAYCQSMGYTIHYVRSNLNDFHTLEADYYLVSSLLSQFHNHNSVIDFGPNSYYFAYMPGNEAIHDEIVSATSEALEADASLAHRLFLQYYDSRLTRRDLTEEERALLAGKTFTVGYTRNHTPLEYTNDEGEPDGVAVEIFNILAERYGFNVRYFPYSLDEPTEEHQGYDFLITLLGDYSVERQNYRITEEYFRLPLMLITSRENALDTAFQEREAHIGMLNYITVDTQELRDEYPNSEITVFQTLGELTSAYGNGEVDAMLTTDTALTYLNDIFDNSLVTYGNSLELPFRLLISRKLDPRYTTVFNLVFDYIRGGEFDEIVARQTMEFIPEYSFSSSLQQHRNEIAVSAVALLGIYFFTVYFLQSRKKIAVFNALQKDPTTNLVSYPFFEKQVEKTLKNGVKEHEYVILAMDIDAFKTIINYYSYDTAQEVLQIIAHSLEQNLEEYHAIITRAYADNFVVFCKNVDIRIVRNILTKTIIPDTLKLLEESYPLTFSVGIYPIENKHEDIHQIVDWANFARNKGKDLHNTTIYTFDESMKHDHQNKLNVTYRMEKALTEEEFILVFQPKVDFKSLQIIGAEALVRWKPEDGSMIFPNDFIPIFEDNGYINKLDIYVFTKACLFVKENAQYFESKKLSVNISSRTMLDPTIVGQLKMIADNYAVDTRMIELEITESAIGDDFAMQKILDFKTMGFAVSIDDFGAGVSSLNRLGSMEADILKLDKAFLDSSRNSERGKTVVEDTIRMAKNLAMKVVAEGVETNEQAAWLRELDCDIAQGYFFSKPLEQTDFMELFKENKVFEIVKE